MYKILKVIKDGVWFLAFLWAITFQATVYFRLQSIALLWTCQMPCLTMELHLWSHHEEKKWLFYNPNLIILNQQGTRLNFFTLRLQLFSFLSGCSLRQAGYISYTVSYAEYIKMHLLGKGLIKGIRMQISNTDNPHTLIVPHMVFIEFYQILRNCASRRTQCPLYILSCTTS